MSSVIEARVRGRTKARVVVVGVGGLGSPACIALSRAGVGTLVLMDEDEVSLDNLHRQILFDEANVGMSKVTSARINLARWSDADHPLPDLEVGGGRFLPENALAVLQGADLVVEGSDNFATKFLVADACHLAGVPVVHASALRWNGTVLAVSAVSAVSAASAGSACYRCVFEDLPPANADVPNCAEAGVVGPMVGIVAALQVDLALALLDGRDVGGTLVTFDGKAGNVANPGEIRRRQVARRADCVLCGTGGTGVRLTGIERKRYLADACSA